MRLENNVLPWMHLGLIVCFLTAIGTDVRANPPEPSGKSADEPLLPPTYQAIVERRRQIEQEIAALGDQKQEWAGEYSWGTGMSVQQILLAPKAGYYYLDRGDVGAGTQNYGPFSWTSDTLHLTRTLQTENPELSAPSRSPTELILVRWGERRYLIPPKDQYFDMMSFVNHINQGREPRSNNLGFFFAAQGG